MRWKQFFTPVDSIDVVQGRKLVADTPPGQITILDVRQPKEYEDGHLPGAKLIPLPQLSDRVPELDPDQTIMTYCAVGGRSRVAAQMLSGKGFKKIYNLAGGIKAWNGETAFGNEDLGLELFSGNESAEKTLTIAYSLEQGLRDFYLTMVDKVRNPAAGSLFKKLADIELLHQDQIFAEYLKTTTLALSQEEFESTIVSNVLEGGLTTEEYINLFHPDLESPTDIVAIAISIEGQALDLYLRAAARTQEPASNHFLNQLAVEEKNHLKALGELMERFKD